MLNIFRKKAPAAKLDPDTMAYWKHLKAITSQPYKVLIYKLWLASFLDRKTYDTYIGLRDIVMKLDEIGLDQVDEFTTCITSLNVYKDFAYKLSERLETSRL